MTGDKANRRVGLLGVGVVAAIVGAASLAAACVPQPLITLKPLSSGPPGSEVTVEGLAIEGQVEIRWNDVEGPQLATTSGPHFSLPVTIPADAPAGLYSVLAFQRLQDGSVGSSGRAAFLVTGPDGPAPVGAGGGAAAAREPARPQASESSSSEDGPGLALMGLGLLAAGVAGGAFLARRRPVAPSS